VAVWTLASGAMTHMHCMHSSFNGRVGAFRQQQPRIQTLRSVTPVIECKESRIGKAPVPIPSGVTVTIKGHHLTVKVFLKCSPLCPKSECGALLQILLLELVAGRVHQECPEKTHSLLQGPKGQLERTFPDLCDIVQVGVPYSVKQVACFSLVHCF